MAAITALNVRLGMDASEFASGADLARREVNRVATVMRQSEPAALKYQRDLELLNRAFSETGKQSERYAAALDFLAKRHQQGQYSAEAVAKAQEAKAAADAAAAEQARRAAAVEAEAKRRAAAEEARLAQMRREGEAVTRSVMSAEQRHAAEIQRLNGLLKEQAISQETYSRAVKRANAELAASNPATQRHNQLIAEGRQLTLSLLSPMERHARELDRLNRLYRAGAIDGVTYRRAIEGADASLRRHNATVQNASNASGMLIGRIKSLAAAYIGIQTITKSIRLAVDAEQAAASFEILTGSAEGSRAMIRDLQAFAARSPITLAGTQGAAKMMMAFNIPAREVMKNIQMLGDISMGNQHRFESLTLAFSQMSAAGRLMGQDLLQMINAGFNPLQEISRKTGESITDIKARMEAGGISAQEVADAFASATSEGGKFAGMTDRLADTMGGKMAVAMSNLESAGAQLGQAIGPVVIALTDGFNEGQSAIQSMIRWVEVFIDGWGLVGVVVKDVIDNIVSLGSRGEDRFELTGKYLDEWDRRNRERERAAADAAKGIADAASQAEGAMAGMADASPMADAFAKTMENLRLQVVELEKGKEAANQMRLEAEGYSAAQIEQIQAQERLVEKLKEQAKEEERIAKAKEKAAREREREIERIAKAAEDAFTRDIGKAIENARKYFEDEAKRQKSIRDAISKGPESIEVGTAESSRFMADQVNARIGAAAAPDRPTPGERELLAQAQKELVELQKVAAESAKQNASLRQLIGSVEANAVRRLR